MSSKPNLSAIQTYADKFADKVCTSFFSTNEVISGSQIVSFTGVEQVNYFIIRRIFEHWQEEMLKIRSPFFDYEASTVKKAFGSLMNELSKNISINEQDFKPLVKEAVQDTLYFLLKPDEYLEELFSAQQKLIDIKQYLIPLFRYMKVHKEMVEDLSNRFTSDGDFIESQKVAAVAKRTFASHKSNWEEPYPILQQFNDVITVGIYELYPDYVSPQTEIPDSNSKIEAVFALDDNRDEEHLINEDVPEPTTVSEQSRLSKFIDLDTAEEKPLEEVEEKVQEVEIPTAEEAALSEKIAEAKAEESEEQSLNDQLKSEEQTPTLLESLQKQQGVSLAESINLNMRFRFQSILFGGNIADYTAAIEMVDQCPNYHTALTNLKDIYGKRYEWDYSSEELMEFLSLVDEKF
ncbi:hypothetical protein [Sediminitomix flava]|uniref:Uncharacterized protein n=1 Tax=Sediminitomix flava TaxID=379075 RepID=A0A315ZD95_SEDFL|nr:hypothetical protein [Sediminitomix flava]PWJ43282.1 hypothetical protein BC781_102831 [Sediminitomix flava]